jgi:hypothetical protein
VPAFSDAAETYEQALRAAAEHGETMGLQAVRALALVEMAGLLYERNEFEAATRRLLESMDAVERIELPEGMEDSETCTIYIALAKVKQAQGDAAGTLDAIQQAVQEQRREPPLASVDVGVGGACRPSHYRYPVASAGRPGSWTSVR